jgi:hypothetical protein
MVDDEETTLKCLKTNPTWSRPKTSRHFTTPAKEEFAAVLARVTSERQKWQKLYPDRWWNSPGLVLTAAHPTSETIYVDYDDV